MTRQWYRNHLTKRPYYLTLKKIHDLIPQGEDLPFSPTVIPNRETKRILLAEGPPNLKRWLLKHFPSFSLTLDEVREAAERGLDLSEFCSSALLFHVRNGHYDLIRKNLPQKISEKVLREALQGSYPEMLDLLPFRPSRKHLPFCSPSSLLWFSDQGYRLPRNDSFSSNGRER